MRDTISAKKVMQLLHTDVSAQQIAEATGVSRMTIARYRQSNSIASMQLELAEKLEDYYDQLLTEDDFNFKVTGIRKAVSAFNNADQFARMYFDPNDMTIWVNEYADENDWDKYHDPNIVQLTSKNTLQYEKVTMREVYRLIATAIKPK